MFLYLIGLSCCQLGSQTRALLYSLLYAHKHYRPTAYSISFQVPPPVLLSPPSPLLIVTIVNRRRLATEIERQGFESKFHKGNLAAAATSSAAVAVANDYHQGKG